MEDQKKNYPNKKKVNLLLNKEKIDYVMLCDDVYFYLFLITIPNDNKSIFDILLLYFFIFFFLIFRLLERFFLAFRNVVPGDVLMNLTVLRHLYSLSFQLR